MPVTISQIIDTNTIPPAAGVFVPALDTNDTDSPAAVDLGDLAPLASPALTGTPTAPTQDASDDSTKIASTGFVHAVVTERAAPTNAQYLTLAVDGVLTNERRLVAGSGINITDGGAGGDATISATAGGGDSTNTGAYASLPAAGNDGNLYLPTDAPFFLRDNGSAWDVFGPVYRFTLPPTSGWSWVNQGSATIDTSTGAHILEGDGTASYNLRCRARSAPATPYTITAMFLWDPHYLSAAQGSMGLFWRDSSAGTLTTCWYDYRGTTGAPNLYVQTMNSVTSNNTVVVNANYLAERPRWFRIADDGVNRTFSISMTGFDFSPLYSVSRTTFLTPNQVGYFVDGGTSTYKPKMRLLSWKEA